VHTDLKPENILFVNSSKCEKEKRWDVPDPKFEVKSRKNKKQTKISVLKVSPLSTSSSSDNININD